MDNMINLTIDGVQVSVPAGTTVLEAARKANIKIPTLCYLKNLNAIGACRMCVVETGARAPQAACVLPVSEGMNVKTNTPQLRKYRRTLLELLLSIHDRKCLSCPRNNNCELQDLCRDLGVEDETAFAGSVNKYAIDDASPCVVRNNNKCVLCRRLPSAAERGRHRRGWPRLQDADRLSLGFRAGADRLRRLRSVHRGLPRGRAAGEGRHQGRGRSAGLR